MVRSLDASSPSKDQNSLTGHDGTRVSVTYATSLRPRFEYPDRQYIYTESVIAGRASGVNVPIRTGLGLFLFCWLEFCIFLHASFCQGL